MIFYYHPKAVQPMGDKPPIRFRAVRIQAWLWRFLGVLLLLIGMQSIAYRSPALPNPALMIRVLPEMLQNGLILQHLAFSLLHVSSGFFLAIPVGLGLAWLIIWRDVWNWILSPLVDATRSLSVLTLMPALVVILGLGIESKAFICFWLAWPPILLNTLHGLRTIESDILDAAALDTYSHWSVLRWIRFPIAIPDMLNGFRLGLGSAWVGVVAAEMLGGNRGLGFLILQTSQIFDYQEMYIAITLIAVCGLLLNSGMSLLYELSRRKLQ